MIDTILIDDLAISPPSAWARRIEQASVIGPLARASAVTSDDQKVASAQLGLGRRQFYNLLASYRARLAGAPPRGHRTGVQRHIDKRKEAVIAQAITVAGAAARMRDVQALAVKLSAEQGIERPSQTSVRTRFGKGRHDVDIVTRLELDCDLVVDLCPLAAAVYDPVGNAAITWIIVLIAPKGRGLVAHQIFACQPSEHQVGDFLSEFLSASNRDRSNVKIGFTGRDLIDCASSLPGSGNFPQLKKASTSRKVLPGEVVRALFGSALGRIPIRSEPPKDVARLGSPVDLSVVRAVVNRVAGRDQTDHG